jgi:polyferredoxin
VPGRDHHRKRVDRTRTLRRAVQIVVLLLAIDAGLSLALGQEGAKGVERFCPFGGIETLWAVLTNQTFTCATGRYNLGIMIGLLGLTLAARKSFCSWVCPVGTIAEYIARIGKRLRIKEPPRNVDRALRWLRFPVIVLILYFTVHTGELIFRPYDPYYVLFSFHGHDVRWWSYPILAGLLALAVIIPMAWCRYLCPLGGVLWPFARPAYLRLRRSEDDCNACGKCDRACPHGLDVSGVDSVRSGECTLCLECVAACDKVHAISLPIPGWSIAILLVLGTAGGLLAAEAVAFPTYERRFAPDEGTIETVTFTVEGVRCRDTAITAVDRLEGVEGVAAAVAYAADGRLDIMYDTERSSPEAIQEALETGFVHDESTGEFWFQRYKVTREE